MSTIAAADSPVAVHSIPAGSKGIIVRLHQAGPDRPLDRALVMWEGRNMSWVGEWSIDPFIPSARR